MTDNLARYPSLRQCSVLVTGGASGIGAAIVEAFCQQGSRVAFLDRDETAAAALLARLDPRENAPLFLSCDLTDIAALRQAIARAADALGPIAVLVNNMRRATTATLSRRSRPRCGTASWRIICAISSSPPRR